MSQLALRLLQREQIVGHKNTFIVLTKYVYRIIVLTLHYMTFLRLLYIKG